MQIPGFRGLGVVRVIKDAVADFFRHDMMTYASALAYQVFFSVFPFVIFLVALLGFPRLSSFFEWLRQHSQMMLPAEATE